MKNSFRIPSLDGLRAISIGLVLFNHFQMNYSQKLEDQYNLGNLGVRVFFVISGFLITGLLLKELSETGRISLLRFYFRRTMRIFIPFYFFLLILFIASKLELIPSIPSQSFLNAIGYVSNYLGNNNWDITHTWSLAVEEQFYLILPGILALLGGKQTKKILLTTLVIAPIARLFYFIHFGETDFFWFTTAFHHNMDALAIGGLLSLFYEKLHANSFYQVFLRSKVVYLFPVLIFILNAQENHPKFSVTAAISMVNLLIVLFLDWVMVNHESFIGKILNSRPLILIGMMSYSIYLWQQPFFNPDNKSFFTVFPYNFGAVVIDSTLSYYLIEKNSLAFRQTLENKLFRKSSGTVSIIQN